ncbi:MAG: PhnE/PtxC family ABC transporter permease [Eggerthellaceae bacterium]|jgi:phosphonate transport system permease protein
MSLRNTVPSLGSVAAEEEEHRKQVDLGWFRHRQIQIIGGLAAFVVVFEIMAVYCHFDLLFALASIPTAFGWMFVNFVPTSYSMQFFGYIMDATFSTILDSVAATVVAGAVGLLLAIMGSRSIGVECAPVRGLIRAIASIFRNIPMIAWALLLLLSFKQNEFTGYLALLLTTFGQITRFYLDTLDEIPTGPVEALEACGASWWQIVVQAGLPMAVSELMSWTLYMVETNIRSATLIGILTGTGIGFVFNLYYTSFRYDCAGLVVIITIVAVLVIEAISNKARRSML